MMAQFEVEMEGSVPVEEWEDVEATYSIEADDESDARSEAEDKFYDEFGYDADLHDVNVIELEDE
jgi:hypothetical protein